MLEEEEGGQRQLQLEQEELGEGETEVSQPLELTEQPTRGVEEEGERILVQITEEMVDLEL